jgi:hypothetical protein
MTEQHPEYRHGGPRPGSGRKFLNGSEPGEGVYAVRKTITLPSSLVDYLTQLGDGNLSKGIRIAAEYHREQEGK